MIGHGARMSPLNEAQSTSDACSQNPFVNFFKEIGLREKLLSFV